MLKLYRDTVKITNENIILATPLILFMWILSLYIAYSKSAVGSIPLLLLTSVTILLMTSAFLSGWFYMVKKAIHLSKQVFVLDSDRSRAILNLIKTIPAGIGKYFLSFLTQIVVSIIIYILIGLAIYKIGTLFIGDIGIDATQLKAILSSSTTDIKAFLDSLTFEQLIKLNNWNLGETIIELNIE